MIFAGFKWQRSYFKIRCQNIGKLDIHPKTSDGKDAVNIVLET